MQVKIPDTMQVVPYAAPRMAEIDGPEVPMIHPDDPKSKQIQEMLTAHFKVFDLSDAEQVKEYESVWQRICNGEAKYCEHKGPDFDKERNRYVAALRWADVSYKVKT